MNRRFDEAANAARRAAQGNPGFSIMHMPLAPSLAAQGRVKEANAAAARVLALQPDFTIDKHCADIAVPRHAGGTLAEVCRAAGLP